MLRRGGSASPFLVRGVSESLAGRVEFVELGGFDLDETGAESLERLWIRGGFPRSFLARSDRDGLAWRENLIRTFLERDVPQLGLTVPALDILTGTFLVRQLQPWHANVGKRQVKAPKIYIRDSGVLHRLLGIDDRHDLLGHPQAGASWEGFALEQTLAFLRPAEPASGPPIRGRNWT